MMAAAMTAVVITQELPRFGLFGDGLCLVQVIAHSSSSWVASLLSLFGVFRCLTSGRVVLSSIVWKREDHEAAPAVLCGFGGAE